VKIRLTIAANSDTEIEYQREVLMGLGIAWEEWPHPEHEGGIVIVVTDPKTAQKVADTLGDMVLKEENG
jgi:hypothetical protein